VLIASVGLISGPIGATLKSQVDMLQAWVTEVNGTGGLNGHAVKLFVYDDGGDPARHRAAVQEAIERRKVIALVANVDGIAGRSSQEYVTKMRVPVVGNEGGSGWFYESPMYFPQMSTGELGYAQGIYSAARLIPSGKVRLATVTCAEASECGTADKVWREEGQKVGFQLVYQARASVVSPDYTSECLAARNAGADLIMLILDTTAVGRFAASCARQGYRPIFGTVAGVAADRLKDDPNLDGMVASSPIFPFFQRGTPATDAYQRVMAAHRGRILPGAGAATGWVAAKLFEKAAANLPEPPTSEAILKGLWSIKNDTLGGLTHPLTFSENQLAPKVQCWYDMGVRDRSWISPDGYQLHCR
jgi:ABC-type branched-subunit amino acid transport system substrate-binding protein